MPRLPRYSLLGGPQHFIQRGHNRQPLFFHQDDYRFSLACLQETKEKRRIRGADACSQGA